MNGGTHQGQRSLAALERPFEVDAQTLDQLVALCARLAAHLRFVDLNDQDAGTWTGLFENDPTMVLAGIAAFDRYAWQQAFVQACGVGRPAELAHRVMDLAEQLDGWHRALGGEGATGRARDLRDALQERVQGQLAPQLAWLVQQHGADRRGGPTLTARAAALTPALWAAARAQPPGHDDPLRQMRTLGFSHLSAVARLQSLARERLVASLDSGDHEPAAGLLLAFLQLYGSVQQQINRFGGRHFDFYHREVLGLQPRPAQPDRVHVVLQRAPRRADEVRVAAGARFPAGRDAAGRVQHFRALDEGQAGRTRVAALATLRLERADDIAPESDLGYVTRVQACRLGLPGPDASPVPVFGGGPRGHEAELGLVLASPILHLREGRRTVELELHLDPAAGGGALPQLLQRACASTDAAAFRTALGAVFAAWLLGDGVALAEADRHALAAKARELGVGGTALRELCDDPAPGRDPRHQAFFKYVGDLFTVSFTHAGGWLVAQRVQLGLPRAAAPGGLRLRIELNPEDPPITGCDPAVHGAPWPTRLPLLRLQVSARARVHPLSLFAGAALLRATLQVEVQGVRDLLLQNQLGPLDPAKPFAPFGPLPTPASALVLGSPEAAAKNLDALALHIRWAGLPHAPGGFATHYAAYGPEQALGPYTASLALLREGQWRPCGGRSARQPLFASHGPDAPVPADQTIRIDPSSVREHARAGDAPLHSAAQARDGLIRLQLAEPRGAFGHAAYPGLLAEAVSTRTRRRGRAPLPEPPYTPEIEQIRLDYRARTTLQPLSDAAGAAAIDAERLLHIHPFGIAELRCGGGRRLPGLLPNLGPDGSLFIGLDAGDSDAALEGPLTLLFQLQRDGAAELPPDARRDAPQWWLLGPDGWLPLDARHVLSDGTSGLLGSGIVTLQLPAGARKDNALMTPGLFWLRVTGERWLDAAAPLISVHAQALTLQRETDAAKPAGPGATPLPPGRIVQPESAIPGLAAVLQPEASAGLRPAESAAALRTRAGERLRHKNRASLAWDYERLVLEHAPEVYKVKCFMAPEAGLAAGDVLVALVPAVPRNDFASATRAPRLDTLALQRIERLLASRASPFVRLRVRNVAYERVQVRCRVQLAPLAQPGVVRRAVNRALVEYLSPWFDDGPGPSLDWTLRCEDVQAAVRRVPGVASVGGPSLLHVVCDDAGRYRFGDTAGTAAGPGGAAMLRCHAPWSLALPLAEHLIEIDGEVPDPRPRATGLSLLRVGETFVIGGGARVESGS